MHYRPLKVQDVKDFSSWDDFIAWKESEEESSYCHFVQPTGKICDSGGRLVFYWEVFKVLYNNAY